MNKNKSRKLDTSKDVMEMLCDPWGYFLIEGDSGGDVYLNCPARMVRASVSSLFLLMHDLESLEQIGRISDLTLSEDVFFPGHDAWMRQVDLKENSVYQDAKIGSGIWTHPCFDAWEVSNRIQRVILGDLVRL